MNGKVFVNMDIEFQDRETDFFTGNYSAKQKSPENILRTCRCNIKYNLNLSSRQYFDHLRYIKA
jgi:hypothetical protein